MCAAWSSSFSRAVIREWVPTLSPIPAQDTSAQVSILRQGPFLIASIRAALDDAQMVRFRRNLICAIGDERARGVVIDVAALDLLDSFGARAVRDIAEMARLRGARTVIVGIQPDVALAMVSLGMTAGSIRTARDLEEGLELLGCSSEQTLRSGTA